MKGRHLPQKHRSTNFCRCHHRMHGQRLLSRLRTTRQLIERPIAPTSTWWRNARTDWRNEKFTRESQNAASALLQQTLVKQRGFQSKACHYLLEESRRYQAQKKEKGSPNLLPRNPEDDFAAAGSPQQPHSSSASDHQRPQPQIPPPPLPTAVAPYSTLWFQHLHADVTLLIQHSNRNHSNSVRQQLAAFQLFN